MRVYIYRGGLASWWERAAWDKLFLHEQEMLRQAQIGITHHWLQRAGAVHINTVSLGFRTGGPHGEAPGTQSDLLRSLHHGGFPRLFQGIRIAWPRCFGAGSNSCYGLGDVIVTPTEYSRRLLKSYGAEASGLQYFQWRVDHDFLRPGPCPTGGFPKPLGAAEEKRENGQLSPWGIPLFEKACSNFWSWPGGCQRCAFSGSDGPTPA